MIQDTNQNWRCWRKNPRYARQKCLVNSVVIRMWFSKGRWNRFFAHHDLHIKKHPSPAAEFVKLKRNSIWKSQKSSLHHGAGRNGCYCTPPKLNLPLLCTALHSIDSALFYTWFSEGNQLHWSSYDQTRSVGMRPMHVDFVWTNGINAFLQYKQSTYVHVGRGRPSRLEYAAASPSAATWSLHLTKGRR